MRTQRVGLTYPNVKSESNWSVKFTDALRKQGAEVFSCVASKMQTPGWPDRHIVSVVCQCWLEVKRPQNEVSTDQKRVLEQCNRWQPACAFVLMLTEDFPLRPSYLYWPTRPNEWRMLHIAHCETERQLLEAIADTQYKEREYYARHAR